MTRDTYGWDPADWAVCDPETVVIMWFASLHLGPLYSVGEPWSNQLAGHANP